MTSEVKRISLSVAALLMASNVFAAVVGTKAESDDQFKASEQERAALLQMIGDVGATVENSKAAEAAVKREPAVLPPVISDHVEYNAAGPINAEDDVPLTDATAVQLGD